MADRLRGQAAIANANLAYVRYKALFSGPRWQSLAAAGAKTQRLLWASTSTKSPAYKDTMYVEALIGRDTVDTSRRRRWMHSATMARRYPTSSSRT